MGQWSFHLSPPSVEWRFIWVESLSLWRHPSALGYVSMVTTMQTSLCQPLTTACSVACAVRIMLMFATSGTFFGIKKKIETEIQNPDFKHSDSKHRLILTSTMALFPHAFRFWTKQSILYGVVTLNISCLTGNFNGNPRDDNLKPDNTAATNSNELGDSWLVADPRPECVHHRATAQARFFLHIYCCVILASLAFICVLWLSDIPVITTQQR